ncbi:hypothetical protein IQ238_10160 [Pleurocapsales cyanobacterium LEGE 06147]|nr:hypothetical protein [Pleurocapsales cyanobacterium LEGE 06147]
MKSYFLSEFLFKLQLAATSIANSILVRSVRQWLESLKITETSSNWYFIPAYSDCDRHTPIG